MPSPPTLHPVPDPEPAARRFTGRFAAKLAATAALLALAAYALARPGAVERERRALLDEARAAGVAPEALPARALLNREIARQPPWRVEETRERLGRVQELARGVIAEQPSSWQALTLYASALTLMRTRTADTHLFTRFEEWERPLELAVELGPSYRFPKETLAFVYLEVWPAIAPSKRPEVEAILREAFLDEPTFSRLVGNWIRIAGSLDAAARLVPDRTWAWRAFVESAAQRRDWMAYVAYRTRLDRALEAEIEAELARAEALAATGQQGAALNLFDRILPTLAPDRASAPRLERLLARRPPAPGNQKTAQAAEAWLAWQRPLALLGQAPLSSAATGRLALLAAGLLSPEQAAFASLVAGNLPQAELYERRSEALWSERWAPYLTLKARLALERGDAAGARAELERAHRSAQGSVAWAEAAAAVGFVPERAAGAPRIPTPRESWERTDWIWSGGEARLELWPARPARGLRLELEGNQAAGGVLDLIWDGAVLEPRPLAAGQRTVELDLEVSPGLHLLALRTHGLPPTARVALR